MRGNGVIYFPESRYISLDRGGRFVSREKYHGFIIEEEIDCFIFQYTVYVLSCDAISTNNVSSFNTDMRCNKLN